MSSTDTRSTRELFRAWRSGDGEAGQVMAQRFADWYYAIATSRLGEAAGRTRRGRDAVAASRARDQARRDDTGPAGA